MKDKLVNIDDLYMLCNKKQWFTAGDGRQYDKLFEMNRKAGAGLKDLAVIIWLCSSNCTIEEAMEELKRIYIKD